jgi:2-hydroxycyclohexanecarboxyl-CoA dehydrogenase
MEFEGKAVIVTGAGQGMGETIALTYANEGANVAVLDLNLDTAKAVVEKIKAAGRKGIAIKTDVGKKAEVDEAVKQVLDAFGTVDILVNNAGFVYAKPSLFWQEDEAYWNKVIDCCYKGVMFCCNAVLPTMIAKKSGKIVTIASDAAKVGQNGQVVYSGAKGAAVAFSKGLAKEVARYSINVNCVSPGATKTPAFAEMAPEMQKKISDSYLFRRVAYPEDIANAVLFLSSEKSCYITGQNLSVSSGYTMIG